MGVVNVENMQKLVDMLKAEEIGFYMPSWIVTTDKDVKLSDNPFCGTAACIGGHCEILMYRENVPGYVLNADEVHAYYGDALCCSWLGLTRDEWTDVCSPPFMWKIKRSHAIKKLEALIAGKPAKWSKIVPSYNGRVE